MSVISISRDSQNNVSIVRIITTDNLSTVASANYIANQMDNIRAVNSGFWQWYSTDMLLISASDGNALFTFTNSTFSSLTKYGASVGGVTPAQIQNQAFSYAPDTGAANAYVVSYTPAVGTATDGQLLGFTAANANSGASTIDVGHGAVPIVNNDGSALASGAILVDGSYELVYNGNLSGFVLINSSLSGGGGGVTPQDVQNLAFNVGVDTGAADAYVINLSPAVTSLTLGFTVVFFPANTSLTSSPTIQINALPPKPVIMLDSQSPLPGDFNNFHSIAVCQYDSSSDAFILLTPALSYISLQNAPGAGVGFSDTGAANAYAGNPIPGVTGGSFTVYTMFAAHNNTGPSTLSVNSEAPISIVDINNNPLIGGEILANNNYAIVKSGFTKYTLLNSSLVISPDPWTGYGTSSAYIGIPVPITSDTETLKVGSDIFSSSSAVPCTTAILLGNIQRGSPVNHTLSIANAFCIGDDSVHPAFRAASNSTVDNLFMMAKGSNFFLDGAWENVFAFGDNHTFSLGTVVSVKNVFAFGSDVTVSHSGVVVWGDSNSNPVGDSIADQWNQTFAGGYRWFINNTPTLAASIDPQGNLTNSLGECDLSKTILAPSTGDTITLVTTNLRTLINPAGTLAALTINLPDPMAVTVKNGQIQKVSSTQIVTSLSITSPNATVLAAPTALAAGQAFAFIYDTGTTTWYPTS